MKYNVAQSREAHWRKTIREQSRGHNFFDICNFCKTHNNYFSANKLCSIILSTETSSSGGFQPTDYVGIQFVALM